MRPALITRLSLIVAACAVPVVANAHPISYTDAWVKISDVIEVRLNVFLDDVVRHEMGPSLDKAVLSAARIRSAITSHTVSLENLLQIRDRNGRRLLMSISSQPTWDQDDVDLAANSLLKLTWNLQYQKGTADEDLHSLCVLHHFSTADLSQPGELRLHVQHVASGKRFDSVIPPDRPHTIILPETADSRISTVGVNSAVSRIVAGTTGVVHEFTAPLLMMDAILPQAPLIRSGQGEDDQHFLSVSKTVELANQLAAWMKSNTSLRLNGLVAECRDVHVEWLPAADEATLEERLDTDKPLPLFGTRVGVRMLYLNRQRVDSVELRFQQPPGPFDDLHAEVITSSEQSSQVVPFARTEASTADDAAGLKFGWQRSTDSEVDQVRATNVASKIVPIFFEHRRPGRWATGICVLVICLLGIMIFRTREWRTVAQVSTMAAIACLLVVWFLPDQIASVNREQAHELTSQLIGGVYSVAFQDKESESVSELSEFLHEDLTEEIYLSALASFTNSATEPLLVDVQHVVVDKLTPLQNSATSIDALVSWRVAGTVHHWGHAHAREAVFTGRVTLWNDTGRWKIRSISLTEPTRFEPQESLAPES